MASRIEQLEQEGMPDVPLPKRGTGERKPKKISEETRLEAEQAAQEEARAMEHPLLRSPRMRLKKIVQQENAAESGESEEWLSPDNNDLFTGEIDED